MGVTAIAAAVTVATTAYSVDQAKKRADKVEDAQEERANKEAGIRASQAARSRRKNIQKAMLERARIENMGAAQGASGSSGVIQGGASAVAQAGQAISDTNTQVSNAMSLEAANQKIMNAGNQVPSLFETTVTTVGSQVGGSLFQSGVEKSVKKMTSKADQGTP